MTENADPEYPHRGRSSPKAQFLVTWNAVYVCSGGQDAQKKLSFKKYLWYQV